MPPAAMASRVRRAIVSGRSASARCPGLASPAQAQLDEGGAGELRRRAEAAPLGIEAGGQPVHAPAR